MADKQITVTVPEERVPEFYVWFANFLAAEPGGPPWHAPRSRGGRRGCAEPSAWSAAGADQAFCLYGKLAPPARELFDVLIDGPGERHAGNEIAARLGLKKGAHGVAGILAWPGRYAPLLARQPPIATAGRDDGGADYYMDPSVAAI